MIMDSWLFQSPHPTLNGVTVKHYLWTWQQHSPYLTHFGAVAIADNTQEQEGGDEGEKDIPGNEQQVLAQTFLSVQACKVR